jgi:hypothetical protein
MSLIGIIASSRPSVIISPVAGYKLWLDAADISSITASGGDVSQWNDKSGNSSNFTQGTGASQPKTGTRTLNGKNVLDFDGTNDFLSCPSSTGLFNYLHNGTASTTFFVGVIDDPTADRGLMSSGAESSDNVGVILYFQSNNKDLAAVARGVSGTNSGVIIDNVTLTPGAGFYLTNKWDADNGTAANRYKVALNNGSFLGSNTTTNAPSTSNASKNMQIGSYNGATSGNWNGAIGEVIFYDTALSDGDILLNQQYLAAKWAI